MTGNVEPGRIDGEASFRHCSVGARALNDLCAAKNSGVSDDRDSIFAMPDDAVGYHDDHVASFARSYEVSRNFKVRLRVWESLISKYARPADNALDIGCGIGNLSILAAGRCRSVLGVDASKQMVAEATRLGAGIDNVSFRTGYFEALAGEIEPAGFVMCSSVLEYVEDFSIAMDVLTGLTAHGGHLVVSIPNAHSPYRRLERVSYAFTGHPRYFRYVRHLRSQGDMREAGESRGLRLQEVNFYGMGPARTLLCCAFSRQ